MTPADSQIVENVLKTNGCPPGTNCDVTVTGADCKSQTRIFRALSTASLAIQFKAVLTVYCQLGDCSDAIQISNDVFEQLQTSFTAAVGNLSIRDALRSSDVDFSQSSLDQIDIGEKVVPLLASFTMWYPRWPGGGTCGNDGNAPAYSELYVSVLCMGSHGWRETILVLVGIPCLNS